MKRSELKQSASHSIINNIGEIIKTLLLYFGISYSLGFIAGMISCYNTILYVIIYIIAILISGLMYMGYNSFFLKIARDEEVTWRELFSKKEMLLSCLGISLLIGLLTAFWSFLFIIPGIIASINYSIAYFVKLDNPKLSAMEVLNKSTQIMNGHKWDFFILILSFTLWIIIGLFTFGLLYLWLIPYMQISIAKFYNEIKD